MKNSTKYMYVTKECCWYKLLLQYIFCRCEQVTFDNLHCLLTYNSRKKVFDDTFSPLFFFTRELSASISHSVA